MTTPVWMLVNGFQRERGRGAILLRDAFRPDVYGVSRTLNGVPIYVQEWDMVMAVETYNAFWLDVRGSNSWNAVLDRLMLREEPAIEWEGSAAEYAARFFDIGTWNWLDTVMRLRERNKEIGLPVGSTPQLGRQ